MYSRLKGSKSETIKVLVLIFTILLLYYFLVDKYSRNFEEKPHLKSFESALIKVNEPSDRIAILIVITKDTDASYYEIALKSVECYAKAHGYHFILAIDSEYGCEHKDKFFRRHCVTAKLLPEFKVILFIDGDIGVVNPKRKIEEFLDPDIDVTFYDRHFNYEVMAGSYLVRNTPYAIQLINDFANYEYKLPKSFHGTDNGAIHIFLAEKLFPDSSLEVDLCRKAYQHTKNFDDLSTYTACIRSILGARTDFGKVRIMKKGTGWARDDWLTSGVWNEQRDFMLHGWKTSHLRPVPSGAVKATSMNWDTWYSPFAGPIVLDRCTLGNVTWSYNPKLVGRREDVERGLKDY